MALNEIRYKGAVYAADDEIQSSSGILYEAKSLRCDTLEANSLSITVYSPDPAILSFHKNDRVEYFRNGRKLGTFYLQRVERVGPDAYVLSAFSALGRLISTRHVGGMYDGKTVGEIVPEICGSVPVIVGDVFAPRQLYGHLLYSDPDSRRGNGRSARDNLAQVLLPIGAYLGTDLDGVLRVEKLWDGAACAVTADQIDEETCSTVYADEVSAVEVTEHQWIKSDEEITLFEGTAEEGALVVFDEPVHDVTGTGLTVLEWGANYARLSAGVGTLVGKRYTHLTRIVRETVTEGAEENVVPVTNATLVALNNSRDVAHRLAEYYRHRETIQAGVEPGAEHAGTVVQFYHPWDRVMVPACIESRETTVSGILSTKTCALVGFLPPQPDDAEYFDERVVLTGSGVWTPPPGVKSAVAVLISGGQGGWSGLPGGAVEKRTVLNDSWTSMTGTKNYEKRLRYSDGGPGGAAGAPGSGGKVLRVTLTFPDASPWAYRCGPGGKGGVFSAEASVEGSPGEDTVFGPHTSASGTSSDSGYTDPVNGTLFASPGRAGIPGSKGHGKKWTGSAESGSYEDLPAPDISVDGATWTQGGDGDSKEDSSGKYTDSPYGYKGWAYEAALGGGPAYGSSGGAGASDGSGNLGRTYAGVIAAMGGKGADALPFPKDLAQYGRGGAGGNGGGGNGSSSVAYARQRVASSVTDSLQITLSATDSTLTAAGRGSDGGEGADGCIILYYKKPVKQGGHGPFVTADGKIYCDTLYRRFIV